MEILYYDAFVCIIDWLDFESLVHLLNTNNKSIYNNCIKYIRQKHIYRDITRYDICRFKRFEKKSFFPNRKVIRSGCSISVLQYIVDRHYERFNYENISANVAESGILKNLKYLQQTGYKFNFETFVKALENGNLENIIWLKDNGAIVDMTPNPMIFHIPTRRGHLNVMKWLLENNFGFTDTTFSEAAAYGNLDNMRWLLSKNCPFSPNTFSEAAKNGNLCNMAWLFLNNCPYSEATFSEAASLGRLINMKWLLSKNCPFSPDTFEKAAAFGNLENMQWLHQQDCPFSPNTFHNAALHGNLENMQWLLSKKCSFSVGTFDSSIANGNLENMIWLFSNGCNHHQYTDPFIKVLNSNISAENMITNMNWLLEHVEHNFIWGDTPFLHAILLENIIILEYLLDKGCLLSKEVFKNAVRNCNNDIVIWLRQNGCPWEPQDMQEFLRKQLYT